MGTQARLPGSMPSPHQARKNHKLAVAKERQAADMVDSAKAALGEAKAALKAAVAERQRCEDDMDAIEAGRRPDVGER
jgi:hypothetical protein